MSLDLGALFATVDIITTPFDRKYNLVLQRMRAMGTSAEKSSSGVRVLDRSFVGAAAAADKASAGIGRATRSTTANASAAEKAAMAARGQTKAMAQTSAIMASVAGESARVQQATLRLAAAQERLTLLQKSGTATTRQLASAQASLIGAQRSLTAAQEAGVVAGGRMRSGMASTLKMAGQLGLVFGAFELVKKAIDITKQANEFDRAMVQVQTNADVTAAEVTRASAALLKMAGPVAAAPAELAVAWYHAKAVGLDYAKSIETTKIAAEGARVGHADLEETMNALTSTVASNIPGVKDMSSAMGQLVAIVGTGDMKLSDLNQALGSGILTVVKGYGLSLTDVGAALATFGDNNIRGADAATMLRMSVQAMAVPAKGGRDKLRELGLTASQLATDMQKGGLNKAILDLKAHLDNAGIGTKQVGAVLTEVFGKRAGPGLAVLIGQVDRLQSKFKILRDAGSNFDEKWKATTQTAAFALASLGHRAEALGITLTAKLGPSIATAANWIGTTIPHAISVMADILSPTVHLVGGAFVGAWKALSAVMRVVGATLGGVGHVLQEHKTLVTAVATSVLVMWAAFKAYQIARVALGAVVVLVNRLGAAVERTAATTAASSGRMRVGFATAAIGVGLLTAAWQIQANRAAEAKARTADYLGVLQQTKGAINAQVVAMVTQKLATEGVYDAARKYGLSLNDVTDAALGSEPAIARLIKQAGGDYDARTKVLGALGLQGTALQKASQQYKDSASQQGHLSSETAKHAVAVTADAKTVQYSIDAHGRLVTAMKTSGSALDNTTAGMTRQTQASSILKNALDALNGVNQTVEQTTDQLNIAIGGLAHGEGLFKNANGDVSKSLKQSTVAGATNRQMLVGIIQNAKDAAQAVADHARKHGTLAQALTKGNDALKSNEDRIRAAAKAAGLDTDEVNKLIGSVGQLNRAKAAPKIDANTAPALSKTQTLQAQIDKIRQNRVPGLQANSAQADHVIASLQQRINNLQGKRVQLSIDTYNTTHKVKANYAGSGPGGLPEGWSSINERGPELLHKQGNRVDVVPHAKSMRIIAATGMVAPGFAGGTVNGTRYSTDLGFHNAQARAKIAKGQAGIDAGKTAKADARTLGASAAAHYTVSASGKLTGSIVASGAIAAQLRKAEADLQHAGLPKAFVASLAKDNAHVVALAKSRNVAAQHLASANSALVNAKKVLAEDKSAFGGAVVGSFDVTTAGANADTGRVTAGGMKAGQTQAITRARAWLSGIKALIGKKIFPAAYLRELAGKGPEALAQVQALNSMSAADMKAFAGGEATLRSLGSQVGAVAAGALDQGAVDKAAASQKLWAAREATRQKALDKSLDKLMNRVDKKLDSLHMTADLGWKTGTLSTAVDTDRRKASSR